MLQDLQTRIQETKKRNVECSQRITDVVDRIAEFAHRLNVSQDEAKALTVLGFLCTLPSYRESLHRYSQALSIRRRDILYLVMMYARGVHYRLGSLATDEDWTRWMDQL